MSKLDTSYTEFFVECDEILQRISSLLTKSEIHDLDQENIDSLYRDIHTLKGSAQLFGFRTIGLIAHGIEATLEPVRQKKVQLDRTFIDFIFKCLDLIDKILKNPERDLEREPALHNEVVVALPQLVTLAVKKFGGEFEFFKDALPDESSNHFLTKIIEKTQDLFEDNISSSVEMDISEKEISPIKLVPQEIKIENVAKRINTMEKPVVEEASSESSTIRVQVSLLDKLMNLVGEMVLTRNQVLQFAKTSEDNEFLGLTQRLDLATTELQDSVMRTRMQPIGSIFSKFQRVVRDLSRDLGKSIDLVISGAETELDKSLIEAIKDPLTHIIRNSCDHGLETPAVRKSLGKPEEGSLSLRAFHEGGQVIIEVKDDGKGIDPQKIKEKAIEKRIISPERANSMSDKEAQELVFAAGFSTAEQISAVSGRGVGMDVVRNNIEKVGGVIELHSTAGTGTTLRLKIPLTLAIVPVMVIRSKNDYYAIPQMKLQELLRVDMEEDVNKVEKLQGQDVYRLRGKLLPLISCEEVMHPETIKTAKTIYNIVVLEGENHPYGLVVDEICDKADIVVKPLPAFLKKVAMFSGATIMGDGTVALIVDTQGVAGAVKAPHSGDGKKSKIPPISGNSASFIETTEFLFFRLSHAGIFAIPLVLVQRLEEFPQTDVDYSGEEMIVKYRESLLPLISLNAYFGYKSDPKEACIDKTTVSVVVVSKNNRLFGLVVDEVVDILTSTSDITPHIKETRGLLGTVIAMDKKVITIVDTYSIIDESMGVPVKKLSRSLKKARVLFAEDTIFFVRQVTKVLEKAGLEVVHAPDGVEALKILKKSGQNYFDFVISDIEMPNMNGFQLASSIRAEANFKDIPIIALTTRFSEMDQKKGKDAGFNKYLEKLKSDELLEAIDKVMGDR